MKKKNNSLFALIFLTLFCFSVTLLADDQAENVVTQLNHASQSLSGLVTNVFIYLGIFCAIAYAVLIMFKKGKLFPAMKNSGGLLKVKDTHMLGNKQFLLVVEYGNQKMLLGVVPGMIQKLSDLSTESPPEKT